MIDLDKDLWQAIVDKNSSATFYHTPTWAEIITHSFPRWKNSTFLMEFEDNNYAVFPLLCRSFFNRESFNWYESMVPGAYGGPVFMQEPEKQHLQNVDIELQHYKNLQIVGNPFFEWNPDSSFTKIETFSHVLKLTTDFNEIQKHFAKSRREAIRYSQRQGVTVNQVEFKKYYQEYYCIYQDQIKRWGTRAGSQYPFRLFEEIACQATYNSNIKLWAAWLNGVMISGVICFYHNNHITLWHNATLTNSLKSRPVDLLISTVIEAAWCDGLEKFDFGKSGDHTGVVQYKEHFGAKKIPITVYKRRNFAGKIYRGIRFMRNFLGVNSEG
ncbi:MAG: GNAT family N-acetyltransferase [Pelolinea sp.]|nr:GNAT family N-acetyltransferase [Pelolinea sp.]